MNVLKASLHFPQVSLLSMSRNLLGRIGGMSCGQLKLVVILSEKLSLYFEKHGKRGIKWILFFTRCLEGGKK